MDRKIPRIHKLKIAFKPTSKSKYFHDKLIHRCSKGICQNPGSCCEAYIEDTYRSMKTRLSKHQYYLRPYLTRRLVVVKYQLNIGHRTLFDNTTLITLQYYYSLERYTKSQNYNNMNRDKGYPVVSVWMRALKPIILISPHHQLPQQWI